MAESGTVISAEIPPVVAMPYTGTGVLDDTQVIAVGVDNRLINTHSSTTGRFMSGYEDLFGGSIKCPTCDGTGKVSRDCEHELVALIPVNDKRLHPRRTTLYVAISIILCIIVAGLLLFFLFPRSISLHSSQPLLFPCVAGYDQSHKQMYMTVDNMYNVSNENFYQVELQSVEISMLLNQQILATLTNNTSFMIAMRSTKPYHITLNATFGSELDYIIQYCWYYPSGSFIVQFQAMATFNYFQKSEQVTLTTYQYIHCPKRP